MGYCYSTGMPVSTLSPRLEDGTLDVYRRAFAQTLKEGLDPRFMPDFERSSIEQHDGLYYVVVRTRDERVPPLKVFRLFDDHSLKGLYRYPRAIKAEFENAEVILAAEKAS